MRFYRALLHLFPRSFRAEYGGEMEKDFAREWTESSGFAAIGLIVSMIVDVSSNALRVHFDILRQDLSYAVRSLRRTPGFTITAIFVAAIGIGATTAAFSIADHVLIRPLPFPQSHRLMQVWEDQTARGYPKLEPSPLNLQDWQKAATVFDQLEPFSSAGGALTGRGEAQRVSGASVGPRVFQMLGREAAIGRVLTAADLDADADRPIAISDRFWRTTFAASPDVLGQTVVIDDQKHVVVGVMPPDFFFPTRDASFWRILRYGGAGSGDDDRQNHYLGVIGRLKNSVSVEDARAEMRVIGANVARAYPKEMEGTSIYLAPWRDQVARQPRMLLLGLVGASVCVLLIACTNLANLLLSRALSRRTEFAVRAAVGASVDRLVRQMLTDSLLLAGAGGALGIAMAVAAAPLLARLVPNALPIAEVPALDLRMLAGTIVLTTMTGLAFGLLPALRVCRKADGSSLKEGARGGTSAGTERLRSSLVVAEIVASVVLIVCVGLLGQALLAVQRVNPGFTPDNLLTMRTQLPIAKYGRTPARLRYYSQVLERVRALPGVTGASYTSFLPMTFRGGIWEVLSSNADPKSPGGFRALDANHAYSASIRFVTPGFFATVGTPILEGRDINASDTLDTPFVAVVSESFARLHFPNQDPIGRSFAIAFNARTIVGVAGDIKVRGLERESEPQVYMPAAQQNNLYFYAPKDLVVHAAVPATTLTPAVRAIIAETEPDMPITAVQTMEQLLSDETAPRVVQLRVIGGFAAIAILLAAIGLHGLLAYTVASRTREIGVRMALGAKARDIMWMVMGRSSTLAIIGVSLGAVLAYAAGRSMQALLFGINPANLAVFGAAIALSLLMALAGSILPAWRAIRVDPITATRTD
jgi:putative ABC transport system permease protein